MRGPIRMRWVFAAMAASITQGSNNAIGLSEKSCIAIPSGTNIPFQPAISAACAISHCSIGSPPGMTIPYRMHLNLTLRSYPCLDVFYYTHDKFAGDRYRLFEVGFL